VRPVDRLLERLEGVRSYGDGYVARCPCPNHGEGRGDFNPSLSVSEGDDRRVLLHCFAGCEAKDIAHALNLQLADLFEQRNGHGGGGSYPSEKRRYVDRPDEGQGCTVATYAEVKELPAEFLKGLGLSDMHYQGQPAVRIPYADAEGIERAVRFRLALEKSELEGGDNRFKWKKGAKPVLYGLWRLEQSRKAGYVLIVEGESDCHTLWHRGYPAVGVPGANTFRNEWAADLEGINRIYAVVEPDQGGEAFWERLASSPLRERLYRVKLDGMKDVSELHLAESEAGESFEERVQAALKGAVSWLDIAEGEAQERMREAWATCEELAHEEEILDRFAEDLKACGVAGAARAGKLIYLAINTRHLDAKQLVNPVVKGPSSAGKSYVVEKTLDFFPEDAYYMLTAMSERALAYSEEPLDHKFLVLAEAAGMSGDFQTYLIRSLLSEGRLRYETVEKTKDGLKPRLIEREGPTGLIVTTSRTRLHSENETRMLTVPVNDSREHTREILATLADEDGEPVDLRRWRALQVWVAGGERRVSVPYAKALAGEIPPVAVRLRRDFTALLNLIRAHALLHRATRERDHKGRIVATLDDYAAVRELVSDLVSEGVEATVPPVVRETVEAVERLVEDSESGVTIRSVSEELELDYAPTHRRVKMAEEAGYLRNLEDRKGKAARLVTGDPLPEDHQILPEAEKLSDNESNYLAYSEGYNTPPPPDHHVDQGQDQGPDQGRDRGKRRLTDEEARQVQRLVAEGMAPRLARAEVLGET